LELFWSLDLGAWILDFLAEGKQGKQGRKGEKEKGSEGVLKWAARQRQPYRGWKIEALLPQVFQQQDGGWMRIALPSP
jgi:hypothetical protein